MQLSKKDRKCWTSGQIQHHDLNEIGAKGIKAIICNRPDGEAADQPEFNELKAHAARLGLKMFYAPYVSGTPSPQLLGQIAGIIDETDGEVLLFCNSGARSSSLWQAVRSPKGMAAA